MLMIPKITRLALVPLMCTGAGWPRKVQAARKGGNSSRSVSSSNTVTLRKRRFLSRRRMRLFFLLRRIGWQHVTGSFPDVAQLMQFATDRLVRKPATVPSGQLLLQERHGPVHRLVIPLRGRFSQKGLQKLLQIRSPGG